MPTLPADLVNRALDECGLPPIGDITDGSPAARAALRIYDSILRELFQAANWNFARKSILLNLLADRFGVWNAAIDVAGPWNYMYEWPTDCVHARYVLRQDISALNDDGTPVGVTYFDNLPAPFLVTNASRPNSLDSSWSEIEGHDPESTRVILTNQLGATLVYTGLLQYPDAWDPLFSQAFVALLAARLAMPLIEDRKIAVAIRADNRRIALDALNAARVRDGDEGWTVQDHQADWITARDSGAGWSTFGGVLFYPWVPIAGIGDSGGVY